ncbi:MAG: 6-bladed beta-propeller [Bacteroidaceae bacterium]|nr:6-bladed beta-propeller [Bacteroidaceae bacterium]
MLLASCQKGADKVAELQNVILDAHFAENATSLSDEFTDFEIIPLENRQECMLTDVKKLIVTDTGMYVLDAASMPRVLSFHPDGRFRNAIGRIGHAKGEYQMIMNMASNAKGDTVAVINYPEIYLYNADGTFLSALGIENDSGAEDILLTDKGVYLGYFHRQEASLMKLYGKDMKPIADIIETPVAPIGTPLGMDNGHVMQEDGNSIYCLDPFNSCFYVCDKDVPQNVVKYSIGLENMLAETNIRDNTDMGDGIYRINSYQVCNGVVRGIMEHNAGYYDFRLSLSDKTATLMHHTDFSYSFDCCRLGYFYKVISASTLLCYMDTGRRYMEPIRKLLGTALSDLEGKVSYADNYYIVKMRQKQ